MNIIKVRYEWKGVKEHVVEKISRSACAEKL